MIVARSQGRDLFVERARILLALGCYDQFSLNRGRNQRINGGTAGQATLLKPWSLEVKKESSKRKVTESKPDGTPFSKPGGKGRI